MSTAKFATRYTIRTFRKMCAPSPFVWLWNMGVREDGCNLKTIASIFKTDLRCQSYNPSMYGAWGSGKISDRNWSKRSPKISNLMFQLCSKLYYANDYKLPWLIKVHSLLDSSGSSYIWSNQIHTIESFKRIVKQRLMDQFIQEWQSRVAENSVCSNYRLLKRNSALRNI